MAPPMNLFHVEWRGMEAVSTATEVPEWKGQGFATAKGLYSEPLKFLSESIT